MNPSPIKSNDESKPFRCPNKHVLGQVIRNGSGHRQLLIYRQAIDLEAEEPVEMDVMGIAEGVILNLVCSVPGCGKGRTWVPGEETLRELLKRMGKELKDERRT